MRLIFSILILISFVDYLPGQFYSTGQAPASVKWEQINTENFQLIYPRELSAEAIRIAGYLDAVRERIAAAYEMKPKKVSILIHNRSIISNGYVSWAPKRSEWVSTPPRESYAQDWLEQLAIHEYRHVVQMSNLDQGLTSILKLVFGEAAIGAVAGYLPLWFYEGDAVVAETAFSSSGRGRESEFDLELRAIELEKPQRYRYDQACLGSYKDFIPNYYKYGYQMVAFGQLKYDNKIWNQAVKTTAQLPFTLVPFYLGLRKAGADSKKSLYNETFNTLKSIWNRYLDTITLSKTLEIPTRNNRYYTDYRYLQPYDSGYFAVRSGLDDITRFVLLDGRKEKIIYTPGNYSGTPVQVGDRYLCWEEYLYDIRWQQQSINAIYVYDRKERKRMRIRYDGRCFSPVLSPAEDRILCLHISLQNEYSLVILRIPDGKLIQKIPLTDYLQAFSPVWLNEKELAFIALDHRGKSIIRLHREKQDEEILFTAGVHNIDHLNNAGRLLVFSYDKDMARNIYGIDPDTKETRRLTHSRLGADFPAYDRHRDELLYSEYGLKGYRPVRIPFSEGTKCWEEQIKAYRYPWAEELSAQVGTTQLQDSIRTGDYVTKPYHKIWHGVNIHSWAPFYMDPYRLTAGYPEIYPGFILMSQNKLSTLTTLVSYYYKKGNHYFEPSMVYEGLFPVFRFSLRMSNEAAYYNWKERTALPGNPDPERNWEASVYLPLNLGRHKWQRHLRPEVRFAYYHRYYYTEEGPRLGYNYLEARIAGYNYLKRSTRSLQPRWGQYLFLAYNIPLKDRDFFSSVWTVSAVQYLPGILRQQGIRLGLGFEKQTEDKHPVFYNRISLPRGYGDELLCEKNLKVTADYLIPLISPDLSIGPLAYFKRFYLRMGMDAARVQYMEDYKETLRRVSRTFLSYSVVLGSEVHFIRFFIPFQPELRCSYLPGEKSFDLGFTISVNTSGI